VSEATRTTFDAKTIARRAALADRIERRLRRMWPLSIIFTLALGAIAISDLVSRWVGMPRRLDVLCLLGAAAIPWSELRQRRLVQRLRSTQKEPPPSRRQWVGAFAKIVETLVFVTVVGYLVGGWLAAAVFLVANVVFVSFALARWHRSRRRAQASSI
jgi:cytochrome b561